METFNTDFGMKRFDHEDNPTNGYAFLAQVRGLTPEAVSYFLANYATKIIEQGYFQFSGHVQQKSGPVQVHTRILDDKIAMDRAGPTSKGSYAATAVAAAIRSEVIVFHRILPHSSAYVKPL